MADILDNIYFMWGYQEPSGNWHQLIDIEELKWSERLSGIVKWMATASENILCFSWKEHFSLVFLTQAEKKRKLLLSENPSRSVTIKGKTIIFKLLQQEMFAEEMTSFYTEKEKPITNRILQLSPFHGEEKHSQTNKTKINWFWKQSIEC